MRQLISTVERLAAKAVGDRIITVDRVYHEMDAEQKSMFAPGNTQCFLRLREGETLTDYICRGVLAVYAMERANLGRHTAAAHRLGMHRNTLYFLPKNSNVYKTSQGAAS